MGVLRLRQRMGPVQIVFWLRSAVVMVHAMLMRCRIDRLRHIDRSTGEPIRDDEHPTRLR